MSPGGGGQAYQGFPNAAVVARRGVREMRSKPERQGRGRGDWAGRMGAGSCRDAATGPRTAPRRPKKRNRSVLQKPRKTADVGPLALGTPAAAPRGRGTGRRPGDGIRGFSAVEIRPPRPGAGAPPRNPTPAAYADCPAAFPRIGSKRALRRAARRPALPAKREASTPPIREIGQKTAAETAGAGFPSLAPPAGRPVAFRDILSLSTETFAAPEKSLFGNWDHRPGAGFGAEAAGEAAPKAEAAGRGAVLPSRPRGGAREGPVSAPFLASNLGRSLGERGPRRIARKDGQTAGGLRGRRPPPCPDAMRPPAPDSAGRRWRSGARQGAPAGCLPAISSATRGGLFRIVFILARLP